VHQSIKPFNVDFSRVQISPPKSRKYLFHVALTSKEDKKDIVPENPDFIGVFTVLEDGFSRAKIVDVKRAFSLYTGEFSEETGMLHISSDDGPLCIAGKM